MLEHPGLLIAPLSLVRAAGHHLFNKVMGTSRCHPKVVTDIQFLQEERKVPILPYPIYAGLSEITIDTPPMLILGAFGGRVLQLVLLRN